MTEKLLSPVWAGPKNVHFFEGRLLTARDLREEQQALRDHRERLGRAIGAGIVEGLHVKVAPAAAASETGATVVEIARGLAVNRLGHTLAVESPTRIELVPGGEAADSTCIFEDCENVSQASVGDGVYVLVMSPTSGYQEFAPKSGITDGGTASGCGRRYAVEGVRFRLELLRTSNLSGMPGTVGAISALGSVTAANRSKTRNLVANAAFGSEEISRFLHSPIDRNLDRYGIADQMREDLGLLTDCDVPLAILRWTSSGLDFVDNWSVRRSPHANVPASSWSAVAGERRIAEGEAVFEQFREHLAAILDDADVTPNTVQARNWFRHLPPVGILPLVPDATQRGFQQSTFFNGMTVREEVHVSATRVPHLVRSGRRYLPVDVESNEVWRLYRVASRIARAAGDDDPSSYVVFVSGHVRFEGDAQFDLHDYDYSNYAPGTGAAISGS